MNATWLRAQQQRLERLGLYTAGVDGQWGPGSEKAFEAVIAIAEKEAGLKPPIYPALPVQYRWLLDIGTLPLTIHEGLKLLGTREIPGKQHSPEILSWIRELGLGKVVTDDETAWCGLFAAIVASRAQKDISVVGSVLWARSWLRFGKAVQEPALGDIAVFTRGSGGHVAFVIGLDDAGYVHILGGNQSNQVNIMRKAVRGTNGLLGYRRPLYRVQPETARLFKVAASGTVSTNEA